MSFVSESTVKAVRKRHRCDGCTRHIEIGQPATRWAGLTEGDFGTAIYHPDCRVAEAAMNERWGWQYGDDWYPLYDIEAEDRAWLIATHPAVAARMGIGPSGTSALASASQSARPNDRAHDEPSPTTPDSLRDVMGGEDEGNTAFGLQPCGEASPDGEVFGPRPQYFDGKEG